MSIKAIFVDFSGVLILSMGESSKFHEFIAETMGIPSKALEDYYASDWNRKVNLGEIDSVTFWKNFFHIQGKPDDQIQEYYKLVHDSRELNLQLTNFLKSLKKEKKIGLISNFSDLLRPILEKELKIADLFDDMIISSEVKLIKPDEAIYKLALQRLQVKPQEAIFVDDLLENVQAAAQLGIHAIQFKNNEQVISEIKQLL